MTADAIPQPPDTSKKRKWLIEFARPRGGSEQYWAAVHRRGYDGDVYSVSEETGLQDRIINAINRGRPVRSIWIPGCGTKPALPLRLAQVLGDEVRIYCSDFPNVVRQWDAASLPTNVSLHGWDTRSPPADAQFDAIVMVNSVVSADDHENRDMMEAMARVLDARGIFIGLFPTILIDVDLLSVGHENEPVIDVRRNLIYESTQDDWQIAYTPLRLRRILREIGWTGAQMSLFFFDSERMIQQASAIYGITDPDLTLYELFVEYVRG
jgi:hypothetical protein